MLATIIISIVLATLVAMVIYSMVRKKKQGKPSCGCGCENCALSGICHQK